jgi:DNA-binding transcriptional regulator YiaG
MKIYHNRKNMKMTIEQIAKFYEISKQTLYNWKEGKYKISENGKRIYWAI